MLKCVEVKIVFREIPGELTVAIEFSNCPHKCPGCHSEWLQEDIGSEFGITQLDELMKRYHGFTCICFMGGDSDHQSINELAKYIRDTRPNLKVAWYSGDDVIPFDVDMRNFDYIKVGHYDKDKGGLDCLTTNQCLFQIKENGKILDDLTYKFWSEKI